MGDVVDINSRRAGSSSRVWPHNLDAEASVLGGILLRNEVLAQLDSLESDDFYDPKHRVVFEAMRDLQVAKQPIDVVTVEEQVERRGKLGAIGGGAALLGELAMRVPTPDNVVAYAAIIRDKALRRQHLHILCEQVDRGLKDDSDADDMISESVRRLQRLHEDHREPAVAADPFAAAIAQALVEVRLLLGTQNKGARTRLFTPAAELFEREYPNTPWLVNGIITRGGVVMIGAEPKVGKTWAGTEIAIAVATGTRAFGEFFTNRGVVAYFYSEDLDKQVRNRIRALAQSRNMHGQAACDGLFVCPRGRFIDVLLDEDLAWIVASCRVLGPLDLLVLDPLRDIHSGEEDKSDSMRDVMRRLRLLGELLACTVAVVHHAPKASKENAARRVGQNLRGSSAIHGAVDSGLYMDNAEGDGMTLMKCTMTSQVKGARSAGRFELELAVVDDDDGEARSAAWTVTREEVATDAATGVRLSTADQDESRMLAALRQLHGQDMAMLCTLTQLRGAREMHGLSKERAGAALLRLEHAKPPRIAQVDITRKEGSKTKTRRVYALATIGSAQSNLVLERDSGGLHV